MPARSVIKLGTTLERNLANYAVAAGTAGVGLLAFISTAHAEVIYTPAHVRIGTGGIEVYGMDVNNDGLHEFSLVAGSYGRALVYAIGNFYGDSVQWCQKRGSQLTLACARKEGGMIGPRRHFTDKPGAPILAEKISTSGGTSHFGNWQNVKHRYLGLYFFIGNQDRHFGWARLNVHFGDDFAIYVTLTGYAYETIPDKPIVAGDEGTGAKSLGHLALGAAGRK
jgi:hypothetical protein